MITETYLDSIRPKNHTEVVKITEKTRKLWDNLSSVWVVAVVNPNLTAEKRSEIKEQLVEWCQEQKRMATDQDGNVDRIGIEHVFKLPLEAISWTVDDIEGIFGFYIEAYYKWPSLCSGVCWKI